MANTHCQNCGNPLLGANKNYCTLFCMDSDSGEEL